MAGNDRALGLVPALSLFSLQDPDPRGHPAAPTRDMSTAAQAPSPVSGSKAFHSPGIMPQKKLLLLLSTQSQQFRLLLRPAQVGPSHPPSLVQDKNPVMGLWSQTWVV